MNDRAPAQPVDSRALNVTPSGAPIPPARPRPRQTARSGSQRVFYGLIGVLGELMITAGLVIFLFAGWQLWWTDVIAGREFDQGRETLEQMWSDPAPAPQTPTQPENIMPPDEVITPAPAAGEIFALIHVPRFGTDWEPKPIISGTSAAQLKQGVGYYTETAPVGAIGNFAIAGHRTTYGRPFHNIEQLVPGDPIVIETENSYFIYAAQSTEIVLPTNVEVIAPVPGQPDAEPTQRLITLTACHPKFSAQERIIVHGELVRWQPKTAGIPAELG